ncbi:MAG TPA: hypothetical protein VMY36_00355 [Patescibacteria group bacterium]|nr:hypothetical protein [Patescibacteria group bacterium]
MFKKLTGVLKNNSGPLILFLFVFLISLLNYRSNTWLSGWDNLHPEFNFSLNIKRSFFSVWQEYQGLGLLGGMGHASDLFRQIFLWMISFVLPTHFLRYFFHFLMLFLGPLGLYFLLKDFVLNRFEEQKQSASLIGATFYLFNLATLQMFYVPFEAYSTHFAFLPWLLLSNLNFLEKGSKKSFLFLLLINLLAIPQGYVATYFLVYFIVLSVIFFFYLLLKRKAFKKILIAYLILFAVNAFWLLPNLYFALTSANINASAKINQMSTETNLLLNQKYGDLANVALLKGFWFANTEINQNGQLVYQMGEWVNYLKNPLILIIGYSLFIISLLGMISAIKKKTVNLLIFIPAFLISFTFLANKTPIFSQMANLFYKIPVFYQVFRFPYTKFALINALCLSIFYAFSFISISSFLKKPIIKKVLLILFLLLPIIFLFPLFQGNLFYEKNQTKIPNEYFQVFDFFKNQDQNTRIANFPQQTFWGWQLYRWNYSGSGSLWYGVEQPILDRAFDPWSQQNENYYWEINYALYSQNKELLEKVLEKYQINWLLVDENIINPSSPKALYFDELEEILLDSAKVSLNQTFGKIKIYHVNLEAPIKNFVFLGQNLTKIEPKSNWNNEDQGYFENGLYLSNTNNQFDNNLYYPFRSLFTGRSQVDLEFKIKDQGDYFLLEKEIPESFQNGQLVIPDDQKELVWVNPDNLDETQSLKTEINLENNLLKVKIPKTSGYYSAEIDPTNQAFATKPENCNQLSQGQVENQIENNLLQLSAIDANNCSVSIWLPNLPHQYSYLITAKAQYRQGKSLLFWLENHNSRRADLETYLPKDLSLKTSFFIQPPMETDGLGYTLHFDNISIGQQPSTNNLGKITVNPFPYHLLKGIKISKNNENSLNPKLTSPLKVSHPNPSFYQLTMTPEKDQILILSQAFHPGWQAYEVKEKTPSFLIPILGQRIKEHFLINNWENGWQLDNQEEIIIIFLPQYLEYLGFFFLIILGCSTLVFLLKS